MVHERPEPLLAGPQGLLGLLIGGNVGAGAKPLVAPILTIADRHAPRLEPAIGAVEAAEAVFDLVLALPVIDGGLPGLPGAFPVIGVQHLQPAPSQQLALGPAHVLPD